ncbi:MAG: alpha/beta fold hydrolase [Pseudomonadota bacterium]
MKPVRAEFMSNSGQLLAARLDLPEGDPTAFAVFAHCFTCTKDFIAARRISTALARHGIGVLRFDFTGLGGSGGEFANTNFTSNVDDLVSAADYLSKNYKAPSLLVGHSLGGAACLAAATQIESAKGAATIGAPADVAHVLHNFQADVEMIEREGQADVVLGGRTFKISKGFVDDAREAKLVDGLSKLRKALLVMHSPIDATVGIENATQIFSAAKHPKSFISLDKANHLLTDERDATYAATCIAAWSSRLISK